MNKFWFALLLTAFSARAFSQEKMAEGVVFDKLTNERIARVNIVNPRTNASVYNDLKAGFKINVLPGDILIASRQGYFTDTVKVPLNNSLLIYLKPTAIQLKQVNIRDSALTPQKRYAAMRSEYSKAYGSNAYRNLLSVSPGSGAGISIDAIWNSISREGRNADKLQKIIERDYRESLIDYRFNKTFVSNITGLTDPELTDFMQKYRPGYYSVMNSSQYDFMGSILANLRRYRRTPAAFALPRLITPAGLPPVQ